MRRVDRDLLEPPRPLVDVPGLQTTSEHHITLPQAVESEALLRFRWRLDRLLA